MCQGQGEDRSYPLLKAPRSAQIVSMSGTPEPVLALSTASFRILDISVLPASISLFDSLLRCLFVEKRKAGGYFQKHLELLEDKVSIVHRCVQEMEHNGRIRALLVPPLIYM